MNGKIELPRIAKGKKLIYLDDRSIDNLMAMIMTLTQEISVLRDRLDTIEQLLAEKKTISLEDIDTFEPSDDLVEQRKERRQLLLKRVLLPIEKDLEK
jgi:Tfp pilus assembly protein PilN